jgi:ABC-type transporter Mla MlaB component
MFGIVTLDKEFTSDILAGSAALMKNSLTQGDVIVVDAAGVMKVDVAALQLLVALRKECANGGKEFILKKSHAITALALQLGIAL